MKYKSQAKVCNLDKAQCCSQRLGDHTAPHLTSGSCLSLSTHFKSLLQHSLSSGGRGMLPQLSWQEGRNEICQANVAGAEKNTRPHGDGEEDLQA